DPGRREGRPPEAGGPCWPPRDRPARGGAPRIPPARRLIPGPAERRTPRGREPPARAERSPSSTPVEARGLPPWVAPVAAAEGERDEHARAGAAEARVEVRRGEPDATDGGGAA